MKIICLSLLFKTPNNHSDLLMANFTLLYDQGGNPILRLNSSKSFSRSFCLSRTSCLDTFSDFCTISMKSTIVKGLGAFFSVSWSGGISMDICLDIDSFGLSRGQTVWTCWIDRTGLVTGTGGISQLACFLKDRPQPLLNWFFLFRNLVILTTSRKVLAGLLCFIMLAGQ